MQQMPSEVTARLLARLWELQAEAGLSNSALAREIGVSPGYLGRLKGGQRGRHLSLQLALRMAERFPELGSFLATASPTITMPSPEGETHKEEDTTS